MEDEWLPQNEYESSEEEVDIDEVKKELFEKVQNIKRTLSENFNIDILKNNLKYMKDNIKLKNYQVEGVNWILNIFKNNVNGILADDMGLGKTIQTICALAYMKQYENKNSLPYLIVIPLSIYNNWIEEVEKFSNLTVFQFNGNKIQRNKIKENIMKHGMKEDICLVTYEIAYIEYEFLKSFKFECLVVDEAHRIKNKRTVLHERLRELKFNHNIFLTGTPIQNNIGELHSLLQFQNPQIFNMKEKVFLKLFPSLSDTVELQSIMKPFILRREKEKVLKLPPISETIIYIELSELQKRLYKAILLKDISAFTNENKSRLHNIWVQLKKCVNHPYLFDNIEPEPYEMGEHLIQASGKFVIIDGLLKYIKKNNHRVLIFSQMTRSLDILQDYLEYRGYSYERLDGSITGDDRYKAVKNFQDEKKDVLVFLLSTRAGGLGLNLTAADTVIFFDNDINPQADRQAAARVYRIGQKKRIQVIRLLVKDSIEEAMWNHINKKLVVSESIMKKGAFSDANDFKTDEDIIEQTKNAKKEFKKPEILIQILKHGLKSILKSEHRNNELIENDDSSQEKMKLRSERFDNVRMTKEQLLKTKMKFLITDDDLDKIFHIHKNQGSSSSDEDEDDEVRINSKIPINQQKKKRKSTSKVQIDTVSLFNYNPIEEENSKRAHNDDEAFNALLQEDKAQKERKKENKKEMVLDESLLNINNKRRLRSHSQQDSDEDENLLSLDDIIKIGRQKRQRINNDKKKKRKDKLLKKWKENHYISYSLKMDELLNDSVPSTPSTMISSDADVDNDDDDDKSHDEDDNLYLHYINGNVVNPSISDIKQYCQRDFKNNYNTYIVHCVDKSGNWGSGGVFTAINNVDPLIAHKYEIAGENEDLHMGDIHLIPIESDVNNIYKVNNIKRYIVLIIAYNRDRNGYLTPLQIKHFENALKILSKKAKLENASIHIPRITQGSQDINWYGIERIIRKNLSSRKIPTFIYYYKRPSFSSISSDLSSPILASPTHYSGSGTSYIDYEQFSSSFDKWNREGRRDKNRYSSDMEIEDNCNEEEEEEEEETITTDEDDDSENSETIKKTYVTRNHDKNSKMNNKQKFNMEEDEDIENENENESNNDSNINSNIDSNIDSDNDNKKENEINDDILFTPKSNKSFIIDIDTPKLISMALSRTNSLSDSESLLSLSTTIENEAIDMKFKNIGCNQEKGKEEEEEEIIDDEDKEELEKIQQLIHEPFPSILKGMTLYIYTNPKDRTDIYHQKIKEIITRHVYAYNGCVTNTITDPLLSHILLINEEDRSLISVFNTKITIITLNEFLKFIILKRNQSLKK